MQVVKPTTIQERDAELIAVSEYDIAIAELTEAQAQSIEISREKILVASASSVERVCAVGRAAETIAKILDEVGKAKGCKSLYSLYCKRRLGNIDQNFIQRSRRVFRDFGDVDLRVLNAFDKSALYLLTGETNKRARLEAIKLATHSTHVTREVAESLKLKPTASDSKPSDDEQTGNVLSGENDGDGSKTTAINDAKNQDAKAEDSSTSSATDDIFANIVLEDLASPLDLTEQAIELGQANGELSSSPKVYHSSENDTWLTPDEFKHHLTSFFKRIDLDPCSEDERANIPATVHLTAKDDGLSRPWRCKSCFSNPPYSQLEKWTSKMSREFTSGHAEEIIALIPARTDTKAFRHLSSYPRLFIHGRLRFSESKNSAPFPSAVIYFGRDIDRFHTVFSPIGDLFIPYSVNQQKEK